MIWFSKDNPIGHSERRKKKKKKKKKKEEERKGRQKKMWEDNIREWTGMNFAGSAGAAEGRTGWRGLL